MITSKQRAFLRSLAQNIEATHQIGKNGITDTLIDSIDKALEARELVKIHMLLTIPDEKKTLANELASATNSDVVQIIGNKLTLFRQRKKDSDIVLP